MPTLDDSPDFAPGFASGAGLGVDGSVTPAEPEPEWGTEVQAMLAAAAASSRVRTQTLGKKAAGALDDLKTALEREQKIAEHEAALARLRRGED